MKSIDALDLLLTVHLVQQIENQNMGTQLKREIAIMRMIRSPNIVRFYECLASKSNVYLVLELVTGGELFELLVKERGFSEEKTRYFFKQLVEGVQCCHKQGICHRDLKVRLYCMLGVMLCVML
jgi:5'-AMP-activated protein kinase catalytic alpha subunit